MALRVVVVEKDPAVARLYREEIGDAGFAVQVLPDLEMAMVRLAQEPAQMVVTDLGSAHGRLRSWLPQVRRVHGGPLFILGRSCEMTAPDDDELRILPKTSDIAPLIASLRREALRLSWSRAMTPTC
ncbi:MAG: hypothetical protein V1797_17280 [Pseudomonadota bacterium]